MQTSKDRILATLKRCGASGVEDLVHVLHLAPMTIRQHLTALERDELVRMTEVRNGNGRPRHVYSLTPRGDAAFPRRYDRFASLLLADIRATAERDGGDPLPAVLERLAEHEAAPHLARLRGLAANQRARTAAAVLHEIGGFAEAVDTDAGIEIRDYNCVYRGLNPQDTRPCAWHRRLVARLLDLPVGQVQIVDDASLACRVLVAADSGVTGAIAAK